MRQEEETTTLCPSFLLPDACPPLARHSWQQFAKVPQRGTRRTTRSCKTAARMEQELILARFCCMINKGGILSQSALNAPITLSGGLSDVHALRERTSLLLSSTILLVVESFADWRGRL
jgi:hypothetical protein